MKKKRDILFLCQFFYPEYISSAQLPFDTVRALQAEGFTVDNAVNVPLIAGTYIPVALFLETGSALAAIGKGCFGVQSLVFLPFQFFFNCHTITP